jgi:hypothetical protein
MDDVDSFVRGLPPYHFPRAAYIKKFTDAFIKDNLPNHKMVVEDEAQYLLEMII